MELYDLQLLRKTNPGEYKRLHGGAAPYEAAQKRIAAEHNIGRERIRKLPKDRGG
jgi:hypothetical protein